MYSKGKLSGQSQVLPWGKTGVILHIRLDVSASDVPCELDVFVLYNSYYCTVTIYLPYIESSESSLPFYARGSCEVVI